MTDSSRPTFDLAGELWLTDGGAARFSRQRVALLAAIDETGSITAAAKQVGLSYKAAWEAVDALNNLAGAPLVERAIGGRGGGGTALTDAGKRLVRVFDTLAREHGQFLARASAAFGEAAADDWRLVRRIGLRTSARNAWYGTVAAIRPGAVNDEVAVSLGEGRMVTAGITHDSAARLGLEPGSEVCALVKASAVMLFAGELASLPGIASPNRFAGTVARIDDGAVNCVVTLALSSHQSLTAMVSRSGVAPLGLATGDHACAVFNPASVILALP
ncbi:TOBE domain-containing protein [Chitinasiproducens palmae]|uniref:Molybdate transport system regulatory protein n=1 Tax=Chitinasiproducens palmae TaxID=1770053 RepID=A0A1H2PM49_9BURK|nr:TOBE domain-containing protein [Chitinasiproducens palmae]SDV47646.1 molybdate transport system regulatory protein [Chitinasiproducens palmae]